MLKKIKTFLILLFLVGCFSYALLNSSIVMEDVMEAVNMFVYRLFPAMFFFYTLSDLLINYGFVKVLDLLFGRVFRLLFHISGASSFVVFMSMLSGFPSGAKYTVNFLSRKMISLDEGNYLISFTHFSNPLFIMGTVSLLFNFRMALIILVCHYLSNFILAFLIRPKKTDSKTAVVPVNRASFSNVLSQSFIATFKIILLVLGNTIFFYTISDILVHSIHNTLLKTIIYGLFDLTKGIVSLKSLSITVFFKSVLILSFLSFGGISVHFQVKEIIAKEKLNYRYFLFGRISSLAIAIVLLIILFSIGIV